MAKNNMEKQKSWEYRSSKDMVADFSELMNWLDRKGLAKQYGTYAIQLCKYHDQRFDLFDRDQGLSVQPIQFVEKVGREERKKYLEKFLTNVLKPAEGRIFEEYIDRKKLYNGLKFLRMPMDAIAFYRPFHLLPWDEWGIYFHARNLSSFLNEMSELSLRFRSLHRDVLKEFVLFEIFHHEFFHHIVESTITTIELILAEICGDLRDLYLNYRITPSLHVNDPLEEALANAYAYNSFSFISRVTFGFKKISVSHYQDVMKRYWPREDAGYRDAINYIDGKYLTGSSDLLEKIFRTADRITVGDYSSGHLRPIIRSVFPRGTTALFSKPDIPTYVYGTDQEVKDFFDQHHWARESCVYLLSDYNLNEFDKALMDRKKAYDKMKKENRAQFYL